MKQVAEWDLREPFSYTTPLYTIINALYNPLSLYIKHIWHTHSHTQYKVLSSGLVGRATVCILRDMLCQINGSLQPSTMNATISLAATQLSREAAKSSLRLLTMSERCNRRKYHSVAERRCVPGGVGRELKLGCLRRLGLYKCQAYPKQPWMPVYICVSVWEREREREMITIPKLTGEFLSGKCSFTVVTRMILCTVLFLWHIVYDKTPNHHTHLSFMSLTHIPTGGWHGRLISNR